MVLHSPFPWSLEAIFTSSHVVFPVRKDYLRNHQRVVVADGPEIGQRLAVAGRSYQKLLPNLLNSETLCPMVSLLTMGPFFCADSGPRRCSAKKKAPTVGIVGASDFWCPGTESNCRHEDFQSSALPTELPGRNRRLFISNDAWSVKGISAERPGKWAGPILCLLSRALFATYQVRNFHRNGDNDGLLLDVQQLFLPVWLLF